jgi:hypothetical protein
VDGDGPGLCIGDEANKKKRQDKKETHASYCKWGPKLPSGYTFRWKLQSELCAARIESGFPSIGHVS